MRYFIILIILIVSISLYAQNDYPRVQKINQTDKIIKGRIGEHSVTIYLSFEKFSNYSMLSYSVSGWYYYDKFKTKIPLCGIYYYDELTLYNFSDSEKTKQITGFNYFTNNRWEEKEQYENFKDYNEKFVFNDSTFKWTNGKKNLKVRIYTDDLKILKNQELLMLNNNRFFDLKNFGRGIKNVEVFANSGNKIILNFEYISNPGNTMGRCGSGLERGLIFVEFNEKNELVEYEVFYYESCYTDISLEEKKEITKDIIEYVCRDNINYSKSYNLRINLKKCSIEKI